MNMKKILDKIINNKRNFSTKISLEDLLLCSEKKTIMNSETKIIPLSMPLKKHDISPLAPNEKDIIIGMIGNPVHYNGKLSIIKSNLENLGIRVANKFTNDGRIDEIIGHTEYPTQNMRMKQIEYLLHKGANMFIPIGENSLQLPDNAADRIDMSGSIFAGTMKQIMMMMDIFPNQTKNVLFPPLYRASEYYPYVINKDFLNAAAFEIPFTIIENCRQHQIISGKSRLAIVGQNEYSILEKNNIVLASVNHFNKGNNNTSINLSVESFLLRAELNKVSMVIFAAPTNTHVLNELVLLIKNRCKDREYNMPIAILNQEVGFPIVPITIGNEVAVTLDNNTKKATLISMPRHDVGAVVDLTNNKKTWLEKYEENERSEEELQNSILVR